MLEEIIIKDITNAFTILSKSGCNEKMVNRKSYGISFCAGGKITYKQNGEKFVSDKNNAVILPKGGNYQILRQETGTFRVINFDCDNFKTDKFLVYEIKNSSELIELFESINTHIQRKENLKAKSELYNILAIISEKNTKNSNSKVENFILSNLSNAELDNKTVAAHIGISETYLNRQFNKEFGMPPKKYIQKARIEKAQKLLCEGKNSTGEIAEMCGFTSIYSFSRAFKNYTHKSPTEYKKELWTKII